MSDLQEQLARRLASMQWPGLLNTQERVAPKEIDAAQGPGTTWGQLAAECIRQMEWARRNCIVDDRPLSMGGPGGASVRPSEYENASITLWDDVAKRSGPTIAVDDPRHPNHDGSRWPPKLTLAPDDWQP